MNPIVEPYVMPADVEILAVAELDEKTRKSLRAQPGDFTVSRPLGRSTAKVVDANTAALLRQFTTPIEIARAVAQTAISAGADPHAMLSAAYPTIVKLIDDAFLVRADDVAAAQVSARLRPRDRVGHWQVQHCLRVLEDVELYEIRDSTDARFAMKLARSRENTARAVIAHEAMMLRRAGAPIAPAVFDTGDVDGFPYLVMEWRRGLDAARAAHELRHTNGAHDRRDIAALGCAIADAYALLHDHGVVHGDVHDANVLVDETGCVTILDFALARIEPDVTGVVTGPRGGFPLYFEPEYATAQLAGQRTPIATLWSDQYALAAMLFRVFTGAHYLDFPLARDDAWRQIVGEVPRSFASCGAEPWPAVEGVLHRGLAKRPNERFSSVADFARALRSAGATQVRVRRRTRRAARAATAIDTILARFHPGGDLFARGVMRAPKHSVSHGSAGIAYALYRCAMLRGSASTLAAADIWATRALAGRKARGAFYDAGELTQKTIGQASLFYGPCGIAAVAGVIGHAAGDWQRVAAAANEYLQAIRTRTSYDDLTIGRAGKLLGCAVLRDAIPGTRLVRTAPLRRAGNQLTRSLWRTLEREPTIGAGAGIANLGIAHGWAGMLFALLRWTHGGSESLRERIAARLGELALCAESAGRGIRWPWRDSWGPKVGPLNHMAGWCNGSAGFVHLWLLAFEIFRDPRYIDLARGAAWHAWEYDDDAAYDLCCGCSGRAYALIALYRQNGEVEWLQRARDLHARASSLIEFDDGDWAALYKGTLGVALLGAELETPYAARMPLFEAEGWPRPT